MKHAVSAPGWVQVCGVVIFGSAFEKQQRCPLEHLQVEHFRSICCVVLTGSVDCLIILYDTILLLGDGLEHLISITDTKECS